MTIPQVENVPALLRKLPCWLLWRSIAEDGAKPRKKPYYCAHYPRVGQLDTAEDFAQLGTFEDAVAAFNEKPGVYAGLAVALGQYGCFHLTGIDLDDVRQPDGSYDERAGHIIAAASSYCEVSPSGKGFKIFGLGNIGTAGKSGSGASAEIYSGARFFAFTGMRVGDTMTLANLTAAADIAREQFKLTNTTAASKPKAPGIEDDSLLRQLDARQMVIRQVKPGTWSVRCPWEAEHTSGDSTATTVVFLPNFNGYQGHGFDCKHAHCQHRRIEDLRVWLKSRNDTGNTTTEDAFMCTDTSVRPVHWLWYGWLALGKVHVLTGGAGSTKSALMAEICAALSRGNQRPSRPPLLDTGQVPVVKSLFASFEDDLHDTLLPRLIAAEADLGNVIRIKRGKLGELMRNHDLLRDFIKKHGIQLIVVDVFDSVLTHDDSHDGTQVRHSIEPWVTLAEELNIAVIGLRHVRKEKTGDLQDLQVGSVQFAATPRIVWHLLKHVRDVDGRKRRELVLVKAKSNCSSCDGGLVYEFERTYFESPEGRGEVIRLNWSRTMSGTPEEIQEECKGGWNVEREQPLDAAKSHLRAQLADGRWHRWREVQRAAPIPDRFSNRTLEEARSVLRIESRKGAGGRSEIRLPGIQPTPAVVS